MGHMCQPLCLCAAQAEVGCGLGCTSASPTGPALSAWRPLGCPPPPSSWHQQAEHLLDPCSHRAEPLRDCRCLRLQSLLGELVTIMMHSCTHWEGVMHETASHHGSISCDVTCKNGGSEASGIAPYLGTMAKSQKRFGFLAKLYSSGVSRSTKSSAEGSARSGSGEKDTAAAQRRSPRDPGHLLASLSCANAQVKDDSPVVMQRHDFALDTTLGPAVFSHSKVSTSRSHESV